MPKGENKQPASHQRDTEVINKFFLDKCQKTLKGCMESFVRDYTKKCYLDGNEISLSEDAEDQLFCRLIAVANKDFRNKPLWRYLPSSSFRHFFDDGTIAMANIISMNDSSEVDYANKYLKKKTRGNFYGCNTSNPLAFFLNSFSQKEDSLTMWRMYAEDGKGVVLKFSGTSENINLYPVDYSNKESQSKHQNHLVLNYLSNLLNAKRKYKLVLHKWDIWQHYFKPSYYNEEEEVRFLYHLRDNDNIGKLWMQTQHGIHFPIIRFRVFEKWNTDGTSSEKEYAKLKKYPLKLEEIVLGPLFPERSANVMALRDYFREKTQEEFSNISVSRIKDYRG